MESLQSLSVVIPVYNEHESLGPLMEELGAVLDGLNRPAEVIFVNDGSTDGSDRILDDLAHDPRVRVIHQRRNFGKGAALMAGFRYVTGDAVITMDADLQDDPAEIPGLLEDLEAGSDLVSGWKETRRDPLSKRLPSKLFNSVTARMSGVRLHDQNCGLKAYRVEVVRNLSISGELYRYIPVMAAADGFRITERAVNHRERKFGSSKFGFERYIRGFLDLLTIMFIGRFTWRPMHLFGGFGLLFASVGVVISAYLTVEKILGHGIGDRPLLILAVVLIVVGVQLFTFGLIAEMIQRNHMRRDLDEIDARIRSVVGMPRDPVDSLPVTDSVLD